MLPIWSLGPNFEGKQFCCWACAMLQASAAPAAIPAIAALCMESSRKRLVGGETGEGRPATILVPAQAREVLALQQPGNQETEYQAPEGRADVEDRHVGHRHKEGHERAQRELAAAEGRREGSLQHAQHGEAAQ